MIVDLHCHTYPLSYDSTLSPDELILRSKALGLDGICLTEHDFFWDAKDVVALAEKHNFLVIPGVEINTEDGHMLVFGLRNYIFGMHRVDALAAMVKEARGAMIAAHPYRRQLPFQAKDDSVFEEALHKASDNPAYRYVCGLEEFNGRGKDQENRFSSELRMRLDLPGTGASDAHQPSDIASFATEFFSPIDDLQGLIRELRAGRFQPYKMASASSGAQGR